jgi:hypothetical protein
MTSVREDRGHPMAEPTPRSDADHENPPGTPRWVIIIGVVVGALIVLFLVLKLTGIGGEHGPGRHLSGPGTSPSSPTVVGVG